MIMKVLAQKQEQLRCTAEGVIRYLLGKKDIQAEEYMPHFDRIYQVFNRRSITVFNALAIIFTKHLGYEEIFGGEQEQGIFCLADTYGMMDSFFVICEYIQRTPEINKTRILLLFTEMIQDGILKQYKLDQLGRLIGQSMPVSRGSQRIL